MNLFISLLLFISAFFEQQAPPAASAKETGEVKWYSFEQAAKLAEKNPRKIYVDVYTNWCGWCKRMDATTFKNPVVVKLLNTQFYAVKLNAESADTVRFRDKIFVMQPGNRVNDLTLSLFDGKIGGYPSSVYLDENFSRLSYISSYLDARTLEMHLKYFGTDIYKTKKYEDFAREFVGEVKEP